MFTSRNCISKFSHLPKISLFIIALLMISLMFWRVYIRRRTRSGPARACRAYGSCARARANSGSRTRAAGPRRQWKRATR